MLIIKRAKELNKYIQLQKTKKKTIGFVPTMGALHEGHISLIEASKAMNDITVCSIFVNPTQFNESEDYIKYPRTVAADMKMLERASCDILFLPVTEEIYPDGMTDQIELDFGKLENILEGAHRPGHFKGVGQVVARFLAIVDPDIIYIGQKDYQQSMVISYLIRNILKKNIAIEINGIVREPDGLAMSSRNVRLDKAERQQAKVIYDTLLYMKENTPIIPLQEVKANALDILRNSSVINEIDYLEIADANTLVPLSEWDGTEAVALVAVRIGDVRLIDNMLLNR